MHIHLPSGEKHVENTYEYSICIVLIRRPTSTSHSLTVLSKLPEASQLPLGENFTTVTFWVCPLSLEMGTDFVEFHTITMQSLPPEAIHLPSGDMDIDNTESVCPTNGITLRYA